MCFYGWGLGPPIVHVPFSCVSMDGGLGPPIVHVPPPHAYAYTHTHTNPYCDSFHLHSLQFWGVHWNWTNSDR